jgi:hypothetical protein
VPSTAIESVRYDDAANTLDIVFKTGRVYRYFAVPATVHQELLGADSKGRYFNEVIRPRYPCERLA